MFVPIDLLQPILDDIASWSSHRAATSPLRQAAPVARHVHAGSGREPRRRQCLARRAGRSAPACRKATSCSGVAGNRAHSLAEFFRMVWKRGPAGVDVPLSLARQGDVLRVIVKSADRNDFLKKPEVH